MKSSIVIAAFAATATATAIAPRGGGGYGYGDKCKQKPLVDPVKSPNTLLRYGSN